MRNQHAAELTELSAQEKAAVNGGDLTPIGNGFGDIYNWFCGLIAGTGTGGDTSGSGTGGTDTGTASRQV